jgi:hypothetical protein
MNARRRIFHKTFGHIQLDTLLAHNGILIQGSRRKMSSRRGVGWRIVERTMVDPRSAE